MSWRIFEKTAETFINTVLKINNVIIEGKGGSDSNAKDLVVKKNNKEIFNIEIKQKKSQIAQFVVEIDEEKKKFYLGKIDELAKEKTKEILKHMNKNYEYYKNPTQGSIKLRCEEKMMYNCVEKYLKEKNIKFLISSSNAKDCVVISSNNFRRNFSITSGNYRRKKSGTTDLPIKYRQLVKEYLYNKFTESNFEEDRKKFFIKIKKDFLKDLRSDLNRSFNFEDFTIFLSKTEDEMKFRIKKKSKTNGPTVIFSIDFHNNSKDNDLPLLNKIIKESK
jgi:hypothetical protein